MKISLHLKNNDLFHLFQIAESLELDFFQCFLLDENNTHFELNKTQIDFFLKNVRPKFQYLYAHGSYKINLMTGVFDSQVVLKKELELCKNLEFTHIVFHPGSRNGFTLDNLAKILNCMTKRYPDIIFLLENTAFYNSFGSKMQDFEGLYNYLNHPEKIKICIDTAHAYAAGYDIKDPDHQKKFVCSVEEVFSADQIDLIHLNDTNAKLGSFIDDHQFPDKGEIGFEALRSLTKQPIFKHAKIIFEPSHKNGNVLQEFKGMIKNLKVELC